MIFEKPSTRTRMSFDIAAKQLGGSTIILNQEGIHYGKGDESIKDTAKVLSEYADIVMIRTSLHKNLTEFEREELFSFINKYINCSDVDCSCCLSDYIPLYKTMDSFTPASFRGGIWH